MRRGWWKDVLAGAATLMDVSGTGTRRWPLRPALVPVTWAVTDEDPGPGWASQDVAQVEPVPPQATWVHAQWAVQQEVAAEWAVPGVLEVTRPVKIWVTTRDVRHVGGNVMLVPGKVRPEQAVWIEWVVNAS